MKHTYSITDVQREPVENLLKAAAEFTKGKAEIVTTLQVVTEDEIIASVLDRVLPRENPEKKTTTRAGKSVSGLGKNAPRKVWTVVDTGERLTADEMSAKLAENGLPVGARLENSQQGAFAVHENGGGKLVVRRVME